jgi:hypothetical protein
MTEKDMSDYWLWLDTAIDQLDENHLPDWFDLKKYSGTARFSLTKWVQALAIRLELETIVADGPVFDDDFGGILFMNQLFLEPLAPNFDVWPAMLGIVNEYPIVNPGDRDYRDDRFAIDFHLPDHFLVKSFERTIARKRAQGQVPLHKARVNYRNWASLNILALVDLELWCQVERKLVTWKLAERIADPHGNLDSSVIRKQVTRFFNDFYSHYGLRFLATQAFLEETS